MATDTNDEDGTDTDEMETLLPYSPFSQLNANTSDGCIFGDVDGLRSMGRARVEPWERNFLTGRQGKAGLWWRFVFIHLRRWPLLSKHKTHGLV